MKTHLKSCCLQLLALHSCFFCLILFSKTALAFEHTKPYRFCRTNLTLPIKKPFFQPSKTEFYSQRSVHADLKPMALPLALLLLLFGIRKKTKKTNKNSSIHEKPLQSTFAVRAEGKEMLIESSDVLFVRSLGNYIELHTTSRKIIVRECLYKFQELVPDPSAYVRIHRSVIVRKDKITGKTIQRVFVGTEELKVGNTYTNQIPGLKIRD